MARERKTYSREFKLEAVRLLESSDRPATQVAEDLDVDAARLRGWRRDFKKEGKDAFPGHGNQTEVEAELKRLQKENSTLKKERDFLKKAATFFAKESE